MSEENKDKPSEQPYAFEMFLVKEFLDLVKEGNLQRIQEYVEKYNLDVKYVKDNKLNHTPLFFATHIKDDRTALSVFKYIISLGVDPSFKDNIGQTVLYYTARDGKLQCSKYLIDQGCPLNEIDLYLQTPIFYACREGRIDVVEELFKNGANIHLEDKYGQTCLFYAILGGHLNVVEFLYKNGIEVNKIDKKKQNPLSFALKNNKKEISDYLMSVGAIPAKLAFEKSKKKQVKKEDDEPFLEKIENQVATTKVKVVLVKIVDGQKIPLTQSELENFRVTNSEVYKLLHDPHLLEEIDKECNDALRYPESWEKIGKKMMNLLSKFKDSEIFLKPVNPIELGIPDYFDIVKNPMDFSTIKKKLNQSLYTKCKDFMDDLDLTFSNCILYNGEKSHIGQICVSVMNEYKRLLQQLNLEIFL